MFEARRSKATQMMTACGLDALIVSDPVSIWYLSGVMVHPGERMLALVLEEDRAGLFVNRLFPVKAPQGIVQVDFSDTDNSVALLADYLGSCSDKTLGIDKAWPARFLLSLQELEPNARYVNGSMVADGLRLVKDEAECELMRQASHLNDTAMERLLAEVMPGRSEKEMVGRLRNIYTELGTDFSFGPIVCYGANAADPHHDCDESTVKEGDSVIADIGCTYNGYCSDMTRTVFYKSVSPEAKTVYNAVLSANLAAIAAVRPGARFCDIDRAARSVIEEAGYGPYFTHRTGHAIGLEVHDAGDVSSANEARVAPGMIFSIEPGIYLEGRFGVRIEDLVLVTEDGCEVLNKVSKDLRIIG